MAVVSVSYIGAETDVRDIFILGSVITFAEVLVPGPGRTNVKFEWKRPQITHEVSVNV